MRPVMSAMYEVVPEKAEKSKPEEPEPEEPEPEGPLEKEAAEPPSG